MYWTEDGQAVISAQRHFVGHKNELEMQWYRYDTASNTSHTMGPPHVLTRQLWEQLEADHPGWISPSGEYVVYARVSLDAPYTPVPHGLDLPTMEIWIARSNGTDASRLYGPSVNCRTLARVMWLDQETEVFFECGYEGLSTIVMVMVDEVPVVVYDYSAEVGFGWMALSADRTKLAFTDINGMLSVSMLTSNQERLIGLGHRPNWSSDSRFLYYLKGSADTYSFVGIHMVDLDTGQDTALFPWLDYFPDTSEPVVGEFVVSPTDNMAVIELSDLWLVAWQP